MLSRTVLEFIFAIGAQSQPKLQTKSWSTEIHRIFEISWKLLKLEKKIVYKENLIIQSLYKAATDKQIPANTIIEFAGIYGFQIDFQRDIRKNDKFQIMYEIFLNEKNEIIETGEILFANLKLSGQDNKLYYFEFEVTRNTFSTN